MVANRRFVFAAAIIAMVLGLLVWQAGAPVEAQGEAQAGRIVVTGHAELTAEPDVAFVVAGVTTALQKTAGEAQSEAAAAMSAVRKALADAGIPDKSVQTRNFSVGPEYQYLGNVPRLLGYRATHDLIVQVDQIDAVGGVLDAAVKAGASQVRQVRFDLNDSGKLVQQALAMAVQDARGKAEALASGAGGEVVRIVRIHDQSSVNRPVYADMTALKTMSATYSEDVQIAAGEIAVLADVEVEFEFR